jgi:hypothetical protein
MTRHTTIGVWSRTSALPAAASCSATFATWDAGAESALGPHRVAVDERNVTFWPIRRKDERCLQHPPECPMEGGRFGAHRVRTGIQPHPGIGEREALGEASLCHPTEPRMRLPRPQIAAIYHRCNHVGGWGSGATGRERIAWRTDRELASGSGGIAPIPVILPTCRASSQQTRKDERLTADLGGCPSARFQAVACRPACFGSRCSAV